MRVPRSHLREDVPAGRQPDEPAESRRMRRGALARWRPDWLDHDLLLLLGGRALRSLAQGYLAIIVPLYLARLGYDAVHLGVLFTAAAIASALLAAAVGVLSDRFGRKTFLILISLLMAAGGLVFALSSNFAVLVLAGAFGTIGRGGAAGSGGAFGPYYPAEQALVAEHSTDRQRTTVFGALSFVGVLAGAIGSLLAFVPALGQHLAGLSLLQGYRALFFLTVAIGIGMALIVVPVHEAPRSTGRRAPRGTPQPAPARTRRVFGLSGPSWRVVWKFMVTNLTNGLAVGMLGPMVVYWFYQRFGVDAAELAGLFFVINLAAALPYLLAGTLARRLGAVNTVVITRAISVVLLAVMAVMPTYALAGAIFLVRMCFNTLSLPVRQSYLMGVIPAEERSSAAGLSNLPSQVAMAVTPSLAGYLMQAVALALPLDLAAALQGLNTVLYYAFFHRLRPPEEREREAMRDGAAHAVESH
jgi:MFS family permease